MSKCPEGDAKAKLCGETAQLVRKCCSHEKRLVEQAIGTMRRISGKNYEKFRSVFGVMTRKELESLNRFLRETENKISHKKFPRYPY